MALKENVMLINPLEPNYRTSTLSNSPVFAMRRLSTSPLKPLVVELLLPPEPSQLPTDQSPTVLRRKTLKDGEDERLLVPYRGNQDQM
jgi:hypothetical protein